MALPDNHHYKMRRHPRTKKGPSLNGASLVRDANGIYIATTYNSDSEESLSSAGPGASPEHQHHHQQQHDSPALSEQLPALFKAKIPKHIFDRSKKDKFYSVKKTRKKTRKYAWAEGACEDSTGAGTETEDDDDLSAAEEHESESPDKYAMTFPSPVSPTKRDMMARARESKEGKLLYTQCPESPSTVTASPVSNQSSPSHSSTLDSPGKKSSRLFSPTKHQLSLALSSSSPQQAEAADNFSPSKLVSAPLPLRLRALQKNLAAQHDVVSRDESLVRMQLLHNADAMVSQLPLRYLLSKPALRHYAVEKVVRPFMRLLVLKTRIILRRALEIWKQPPLLKMNEKQARFMVIADCFVKLLRTVFKRAFNHWAWHYSSRRNREGRAMKQKAAADIQRWFRQVRVTSKEAFKRLTEAVQTCLHRRKAIKHFIQFETSRRSAILKMRRAIFRKRRSFYGARALGRVWRWVKLLRKTQWRLTRSLFVKRLQRWYRMVRCRPAKELFIIHLVIKCGGYSVVRRKINPECIERNGFLLGIDATVTQIQRAWYKSRGQFALFLLFAARRAKMEYEQMLNENATIIQDNFRGHLWNLLNLAAMQHNRSRRISKGFRSYQYRHACFRQLVIRQNRMARKIQHAMQLYMNRRFLKHRFRLRKAFLIFTRAKKTMAAIGIQRQYRAHVERERIKREILIALIAGQRAQAALVAKNISTIQRNWRQFVTKTFPEHVKLVCWRLVCNRRRQLREAALKIQKRAKIFIKKQIKKRKKLHKKMANRIWLFSKARLLALALWDRVEARRFKEKLASICMQRNFRLFTFFRIIKTRCLLRGAQREFRILCFNHATYIERWMRRKTMEYFLPVRVAARRQLKKKREVEEARRLLHQANKAARFIVGFFRLWPVWSKTLARIHVEFVRIKRHRAAKKMQKFARRVIAWARFDRVVAYKRKCIHDEEQRALQMVAANMVGHYWQRFKEKRTLGVRFKNRRSMLDEWHRLEELRLKAMKERAWALEEKRRTDENMRATIAAGWKQVRVWVWVRVRVCRRVKAGHFRTSTFKHAVYCLAFVCIASKP